MFYLRNELNKLVLKVKIPHVIEEPVSNPDPAYLTIPT